MKFLALLLLLACGPIPDDLTCTDPCPGASGQLLLDDLTICWCDAAETDFPPVAVGPECDAQRAQWTAANPKPCRVGGGHPP